MTTRTMIGSFYGVTPYLSGNDSLSCEPWYAGHPERICDKCGGEGCLYEDIDHNTITLEEYNTLSEYDKEYYDETHCPECDGGGYID